MKRIVSNKTLYMDLIHVYNVNHLFSLTVEDPRYSSLSPEGKAKIGLKHLELSGRLYSLLYKCGLNISPKQEEIVSVVNKARRYLAKSLTKREKRRFMQSQLNHQKELYKLHKLLES